MRTLWPDPPPVELAALLERRRLLGLDDKDEVWEGVLHVVPAPSGEHSAIGADVKSLIRAHAASVGFTVSDEFNLGDERDFRVPDGGLHRCFPRGVWIPTAALVIEILSPRDETWEKLPFYAAHDVDELLIVDPDAHEIHWLALAEGKYAPVERSRLIELGAAQLAQQIDWPLS